VVRWGIGAGDRGGNIRRVYEVGWTLTWEWGWFGAVLFVGRGSWKLGDFFCALGANCWVSRRWYWLA